MSILAESTSIVARETMRLNWKALQLNIYMIYYRAYVFMNLLALELNLLVVLDALLDEVHVSRAANRLGLTQPATSVALQRCRVGCSPA